MSLPTLAKYELLARLGEGATGSVYKARHRAKGTLVAVKIITETLGSDPTMIKRLEQEFLAVSQLGHRGIVRGLDFGQEGQSHYLVMELLDGISLAERIRRHGGLPEPVAVGILAEVAQALHAAHESGLLHRDVKPSNVMLTRDGQVKLTDFGLVKETGTDLVLTPAKDLLGTPNYMAPELFDGADNASVRSDIYSLAATLFTAATGQIPFGGKTCLAILTRKLRTPLAGPRQTVPTLTERTEGAILRGLDPDPKKRPASCLEFVAALETSSGETSLDSATGTAGKSRPQPPVERRSQPRRRPRGSARYKPAASPFGPAAKAILVDASTGGVQLLLQERFKVGEWLEVELLTPQGVPVLKREVVIRWAAGTSGNLCCRIGGSWKRPLTHAELQAFA